MTINGINGTNTQRGQMGMNPATDSYSRNIQNQIANAKKQLQELSSNEEMTLEEKRKKRQEIQQQISDLNMQLRQHQMEQRRAAVSGSEKRQAKNSSVDEMSGGTNTKAGGKSAGLSQAGMTAMISAETSMKQAKVHGSVAAEMKGRANVVKAEMKQSGSTEAKKAELADLEQKAVNATASQMNILAEANKTVEEAAAAERTENKASDTKEEKAIQAEGKTEKTADSNAKGEKAQDGVSGTEVHTENTENAQQDNGTQTQDIQPVETAGSETQAAQAAAYTHVDVRL